MYIYIYIYIYMLSYVYVYVCFHCLIDLFCEGHCRPNSVLRNLLYNYTKNKKKIATHIFSNIQEKTHQIRD